MIQWKRKGFRCIKHLPPSIMWIVLKIIKQFVNWNFERFKRHLKFLFSSEHRKQQPIDFFRNLIFTAYCFSISIKVFSFLIAAGNFTINLQRLRRNWNLFLNTFKCLLHRLRNQNTDSCNSYRRLKCSRIIYWVRRWCDRKDGEMYAQRQMDKHVCLRQWIMISPTFFSTWNFLHFIPSTNLLFQFRNTSIFFFTLKTTYLHLRLPIHIKIFSFALKYVHLLRIA